VSFKSILVIDDDVHVRRTLGLLLRGAGYQVKTAGRTWDAIRFQETGSFDLVLLDIKMSENQGLSFLPKLRILCPELPVVILTAYPAIESENEAERLQAQDYLVKPVDPDLLLNHVHEVLSRHSRK